MEVIWKISTFLLFLIFAPCLSDVTRLIIDTDMVS